MAVHQTAAGHAVAFVDKDALRRPLDLAESPAAAEVVDDAGGRSATSSGGMPWLVGELRGHGASAGC